MNDGMQVSIETNVLVKDETNDVVLVDEPAPVRRRLTDFSQDFEKTPVGDPPADHFHAVVARILSLDPRGPDVGIDQCQNCNCRTEIN